jgi:hypothetical protein
LILRKIIVSKSKLINLNSKTKSIIINMVD